MKKNCLKCLRSAIFFCKPQSLDGNRQIIVHLIQKWKTNPKITNLNHPLAAICQRTTSIISESSGLWLFSVKPKNLSISNCIAWIPSIRQHTRKWYLTIYLQTKETIFYLNFILNVNFLTKYLNIFSPYLKSKYSLKHIQCALPTIHTIQYTVHLYSFWYHPSLTSHVCKSTLPPKGKCVLFAMLRPLDSKDTRKHLRSFLQKLLHHHKCNKKKTLLVLSSFDLCNHHFAIVVVFSAVLWAESAHLIFDIFSSISLG